MNTRIFESDNEAQLVCEDWQDRLGLLDWDVRVSFADRVEDLNGDEADIQWDLNHRRAMIRLATPETFYNGSYSRNWPIDHERNLVHELLHLHFALFPAEDKSLQDVAQEQAINALATALVQLRRGVSEQPVPWVTPDVGYP